jgi:xylulokinase
VAARDWSDTLLAACGLSRDMMPALFEGNQVTGHLTAEMAHRFGLPRVPVVAGGGDNAAGAVGVGVVAPGQAMLSLGTSGVSFVATDRYRSNPERAVHSFCHALPNTWHLMSVMLSAASCLDFTAKLSGQADVATLLAAAEARGISDTTPTFLPYLTGERTPHNNPAAQACFFGLTGAHDSADMANAALEGIGLGLKDGFDALDAAGASPDNITLIGGGSRSAYWAQMLADIIGRTLVRRAGGDVGPALGAARLAHLALAPETPLAEICRVPDVIAQYHPDPARQAFFQERRRPRFLDLYQRLAPLFPKP